MKQDGEGWNVPLIQSMFNEFEAQTILRIPVSSMGVNDRLMSHSTTNGQYSVPSGYKLAKLRKQQAKGKAETSRSNGEEERKLWKKVWNLDIKKKIQNFIWKACHDRIPVGVNLKKRGLKIDKTCKLCGEKV